MASGLKYHAMRTIWAVLLVSLIIPCPAAVIGDSFTVQEQREMTLSDQALDLTVSSDGRWTFVLTRSGDVAIYEPSGDLIQTLKVGSGYNRIEYSQAGNRLLLSDPDRKSVKVLTLAMLYELDYRDSPFKGSANAPVTIAVFDDFQ
jgi:hypothetical protein